MVDQFRHTQFHRSVDGRPFGNCDVEYGVVVPHIVHSVDDRTVRIDLNMTAIAAWSIGWGH